MTTKHLSEEAIQWYAIRGDSGEAPGRKPGAEEGALPGSDAGAGVSDAPPGPWQLADIISHMRTCESCTASVAAYRAMFTTIAQQPAPVFGFDLSAAVLSRLSPQGTANPVATEGLAKSGSPSHGLTSWLAPLLGVVALGSLFYFFRKYILELFSGVSSMLIYLSVVMVVGVVIFQSVETYRKYQRKIDALNVY
ncbi:MAG TPA: hypothetical protein VK563_17965 [Puia sp.]|nr:hypothetical protein [Puia sp.]